MTHEPTLERSRETAELPATQETGAPFDRDLLTANYDSSDVSFRSGIGGGHFGRERRFAAAAGPLWLAADDFDGNGRLDLLTLNQYYESELAVILNAPRPDGS